MDFRGIPIVVDRSLPAGAALLVSDPDVEGKRSAVVIAPGASKPVSDGQRPFNPWARGSTPPR